MDTLAAFLSQSFPPKSSFTEGELGDLAQKVFIITGGYSGVGLRLAKIVYRKNATVYLAGRSEDTAYKAIQDLKSSCRESQGRLEYIPLSLDDLSTSKSSVNAFLEKEKRLDVIWNNAGFMGKTATTKQGHGIHLATNCLGSFLFTKLLHPLLVSTAKCSPEGTVRVVWLASIVSHLQSPSGGMDLDNLDYQKKSENDAMKYVVSKTGNLFIGSEWARRDAEAGVLHLTVNPGNLKTPLQRNMGNLERRVTNVMLYDPIYGAYTELFAGLSPTIKPADSGRYIIPWGRFGSMRADIEAEMQAGQAGKAARFFDYCESKTKDYC